eukprot:1265323-Amphidinium_carterae.1
MRKSCELQSSNRGEALAVGLGERRSNTAYLDKCLNWHGSLPAVLVRKDPRARVGTKLATKSLCNIDADFV